MNELLINQPYALTSKELTKEMESIRKALNSAIKSAMTIGKSLKVIKDRELWKDDYKSFEECAGQFGIKKAQAYNLIKGYEVYKKYALEDYTNTQCVEIAKLDKAIGEKGTKSVIEEGIISPSMSTKELRETIDLYLNPDKVKELEEELEEETEEERDPKYIDYTEEGEIVYWVTTCDGKYYLNDNELSIEKYTELCEILDGVIKGLKK